MRNVVALFMSLGAACLGCGEASTSQNAGAGGTAAGGAGASGGAGANGRCTEIRLEPRGMIFVAQEEWARVEDGLIKVVGVIPNTNNNYSILVREFYPSGEKFKEFVHSIHTDREIPLDCAWKGNIFFCAGWSEVILGEAISSKNLSPLDIFAGSETAIRNHWDGEAFTSHFSSGKDGSLNILRLNTEGEVVQNRFVVATKFSQFFTNERGRIVTDPISGRTFVLQSSSSPYLRVSAHERDGTPLFPMDTLLDTSPHLTNSYPAVGVYPDGILVATVGDNTAKDWWPKPHFYRISASGELTTLPDIPLPENEACTGGLIDMAIVAHDANNAWIMLRTDTAKANSRLLVIDWKDGQFGPLQVVMDSQDAGPVKNYFFKFKDPIAFEVEGQRWVGVKDLSAPGSTVRLLRVDDPSCRYAPIIP